MSAARAPRHFTTGALKARCRALREQLVGQQVATAEEVAAVWPGGAQNFGAGMDGWIECYAQLTRFAGRLESQARPERPEDAAELEAIVRGAAARQPIPVALSCGDYPVNPKSAHALLLLDGIEAVHRPLARLQWERAQADTPSDAGELEVLLAMARSLAMRTWAWILTTPGAGLPFEDHERIEPPAWTKELLPEDLLRIYVAHRQLHAESIAIMAAALPSDGGPARSRLSLTGFLTGYASEHGLPPSQLMRQWSLPEAVAAAVAAAEAHRVAEENAKSKHRSPTGSANAESW